MKSTGPCAEGCFNNFQISSLSLLLALIIISDHHFSQVVNSLFPLCFSLPVTLHIFRHWFPSDIVSYWEYVRTIDYYLLHELISLPVHLALNQLITSQHTPFNNIESNSLTLIWETGLDARFSLLRLEGERGPEELGACGRGAILAPGEICMLARCAAYSCCKKGKKPAKPTGY